MVQGQWTGYRKVPSTTPSLNRKTQVVEKNCPRLSHFVSYFMTNYRLASEVA